MTAKEELLQLVANFVKLFNMSPDSSKIILKSLEELAELSAILLQDMNKSKDLSNKVVGEIKDVEKYLKLLKGIYNIEG